MVYLDIDAYMKRTQQERQEHLRLEESCVDRGGNPTQFRGLLAQFLNTSFPHKRNIHLCHACNNGFCSNPYHLYWGTSSENIKDMHSDPKVGPKARQKMRQYATTRCRWNGMVPWEVQNANIDAWRKAKVIFDETSQIGWNGYGTGYSAVSREFDIPIGSARKMVIRFRHGWNPNKDQKWLSFYGKTDTMGS